ncbi:family 20 glycosylhydrolase [Mediterraneibacter glycyrrhizinilyticus]|uniref:family 20 glycosylhydrolase n=1 Tax=Mediterraneibacter glycyrrhizinilyticus TaxID=342942 RepID=UPI0025AB07DA|nr:family 20 glycosylhydrolase [Mediterraneibacter glycyrrhizinilyticus]MDN0061406.1 family 20 glycosylhydrolase [Mediterraneibacter glycyrrhizinilyticus]
MKRLKKVLSLVLSVCMILGMTMTVSAEGPEQQAAGAGNDYRRIVHLDAGRKYFSVDQIKGIIDTMAESNYNALELAVGNDGLRFLLNDMSVTVGETTYSSEQVTEGIKQGNSAYSHAGELSQTEMNTIIQYANEKGIEIIPLLNTPGHMDAIVDAMEYVGIEDAAYGDNYQKSARTLNIMNETAVGFTQQLVKKYVDYFSGKGCSIFNMGCDEFANDIYASRNGMGFGALQDNGQYDDYIVYVNSLAQIVKEGGMTPMAFNDGFYYNGVTDQEIFDSSIMIAYWTTGWGSNYLGVQSAATLAGKGHSIINTNSAWYYVLGATSGSFPLSHAQNGVANTKYNDVPGDNDPAAAGSMICFWCDDPSVDYNTYSGNVKELIQSFAANNQDVFGSSEEDADNPGTVTPDEEKIEKTITVAEGETIEDIISGNDFSNDVNRDELNTSIADVSAEYVDIPGEMTATQWTQSNLPDGKYLIETNRGKTVLTDSSEGNKLQLSGAVSEAGESDLWTITHVNGNSYYVQNADGQYLNIGDGSASLSRSRNTVTISYSSGMWRFSETESGLFWSTTYYLNQFGGDTATVAGGYDGSASDPGSQWNLYTLSSSEPVAGTKVTFTGNQAGTTHVTVGNVHYTINVIPKDLSNVKDLNINLFISTSPVWDVDDNTHNSDIALSAADAYSEQGVNIADLVPEVGWWQWASNETQTVFWKGTVLPQGLHQTDDTTNDRSMSGTDYTYLRYWNDRWEYSADGSDWTAIRNSDEVNAYYLQKTTVTDEVDTYVKDWAFTTSNSQNQSGDVYQKALSFAVVYPNGKMNPTTEAGIYADSTLIYWENLKNLGFIRVGVNEVYEVEKITYTMGERANHDSQSNWGPNDSIDWEKKRVDYQNYWYDETICWDESYGTEPVINGQDLQDKIYAGNRNYHGRYNGTWGFNDAVLILIYLKPVESEDSLTVQYWDDSADSLIYDYPINVTNVSTEDPGTFLNRLMPEDARPEGPGKFELRDDAYIVNAKNEEETFQKDLTKIPSLFGKYTSGLYEYTGADISEDGKTLTLHYNLDESKLSASYVVDFGLPVTIPMDEIVENTANIQSVMIGSTRYGTAAANGTESITYTPSTVMGGNETLGVTVTYGGDEMMTHSIAIIPATTTYYEEGFAEYTDGDWSGNISKGSDEQAAEAAGKKTNVYGADDKYKEEAAGPSNGTQATSTAYKGNATFTFRGTGVDIYANCTPETGKLSISVTNAAGSLVKFMQVDTAMKNGTTDATSGQAVTGYNVPVASLDLGTTGTYTVKISHMKPNATATGDTVNLDGFRVYGTLDGGNEAYVSDGEANPSFIELRDQVLKGLNVQSETSAQYAEQIAKTLSQVYSTAGAGEGAAVITDANLNTTTANVQDLLDKGPKNELYLKGNQAVTFKVDRDVQIGLKALNGAVTYSMNNGGDQTLSSSTDMFYEAGNGTITITNKSTGDAILSVTKVKAAGAAADASNGIQLCSLTESDFMPALLSLGFESEAEEPVYADATANISLIDAAGSEIASTALTANGTAGEIHTFAAADIQAAAEGVLPEGYELTGEASDVEVAYGESETVELQAEEAAVEEPDNSETEDEGGFFDKIGNAIKDVVDTAVDAVTGFFGSLFGW